MKTKPAPIENEPATTRELSDGARIGRALTRLQAINEAERQALSASPTSIAARFALRREALLDELEPGVRAAVLAAATALGAE